MEDELYDIGDLLQYFHSNRLSFERLNTSDCYDEYKRPFITDRSNLFIVSSWNASQFGPGYASIQNAHVKARGGSEYGILDGTYGLMDRPVIDQWDIQQCWSQRSEEHCKLQFSPIIMIVVIICNLFKLVSMAWTAWRKDSEPLVTLGDALASYMTTEDKYWKGSCLANINNLGLERAQGKRSTHRRLFGPVWKTTPIKWAPARKFWFSAVTGRRWLFCYIL
ncbi:MAG: hypothetical protein LQ351_001185 [Letrouitia transgressa]|nr:MAG: hypothetical protein LQ351_001185 [Letrouitia transgressa]